MCVSCLVTLWKNAQIIFYLALSAAADRNAIMASGDGDTLTGVPHTTGVPTIVTYKTHWIHWELMDLNDAKTNEPARQR